VGVDLGGSLTRAGLAKSCGEIIDMESMPTEGERGPGHVVRGIARMVDDLVERNGVPRSSLRGVGIGSPGPLNTKTGVIVNTPNLRWRAVPLRDLVEEAVGVRAVLENDANAAALGEWWKGAGAGVSSLVCFTLGTGVGGGIVIAGDIWHGATDVAGELGHMTIETAGRRCNCGNYGCLEAYASATAISVRAREGIEKGRQSSLKEAVGGELDTITSEIVYEQAVAGDPFCREVMTDTARYLAVGVANMLNIFNPEVVVIGGGVTRAGDVLFRPLAERVRGRAFPMALEGVRVVPAELGTNAGLIGAVAVIKKAVEGSLGD
jgi:glucokinase